MDIVRQKKTQKPRLIKTSAIAALVLVSMSLFYWFDSSTASYLASRDTLLIDTVKRGELNITVRGTGVLAPEDFRWMATNVSGRVERILKRAGTQVMQGELLLELSNPQLEQELIEAKWELQALEAETRARKVALESDLLDQQIVVINEKLNLESSELTLNAQKELLQQGIVAISKIDFEQVRMNVNQYQQRWQLEQKRLVKRQENLTAQLDANQARLNSMRKRVERIQQQVDSLKVIATMDSIVQEMPMELGQQVSSGTNLALLARSDKYIAELRIPEKQIRDVVIGQKVSLDTRSSQIEGRVQRIDAQVVNNSVQVDVALVGELPKEVRPELTVDGVIEIATIDDTLFVKRPMYANSFSQSSVYLIEQGGAYAARKPLRFGHMSSQYIQVEQGLQEGDSIIVSDTSDWQNHQQIRIN